MANWLLDMDIVTKKGGRRLTAKAKPFSCIRISSCSECNERSVVEMLLKLQQSTSKDTKKGGTKIKALIFAFIFYRSPSCFFV
ncbi:MAG: hypothetical protein LPH21_05825 [Shewanella sp.]|nr:hypothetical protein [Shewanella sp.]